jgi:hypothetical protein
MWLLILILVGTWVRFQTLEQYFYGNDEAMHIEISAGENLQEVWQFSRYETHPPLGHFIRYYWMKISHNPTWVRSMGILSDALLVILYFFIGKRFGTGVGIAASFLAAFSSAFISLARVVRNYSIFALFEAACFYFYLRYCENKQTKWLVLYIIFGCAAVSTHFGGIIPIIGFAVTTFFKQIKCKENPTKWVLGNGIIALFFLAGLLSQHWSNHYIYLYYDVFDKIAGGFNIFNSIILGLYALLELLLAYPTFILPALPDIAQGVDVNTTVFMYFIPTNAFQGAMPPILFVASLVFLYKSNRQLFYVMLLSSVTFILLASFGLYDAMLRRNVWIAPFIIIPVSIFISYIYNKILLINRPFVKLLIKCAMAFCVLATVVCAVLRKDIYNYNDYYVRKQDIASMQEFVDKNISDKDVIIGARSAMICAYLHLAGSNYYHNIANLKAKEYYLKNHIDIHAIPIKETFLNKTYISFPLTDRFHSNTELAGNLEIALNNQWLDDVENVWFVNIADLDPVVGKILNCSSVKPEIKHIFLANNIWVFSINKKTFMELIKPDGKYQGCFDNQKASR